jgi:site-specific DNA-adenine methylase
MYVDPPYLPKNSTSFVTYTATGFPEDEHEQLFCILDYFETLNIGFVLSSSNVDIVREIFPEDRFLTAVVPTTHLLKPNARHEAVSEVLIRPRFDSSVLLPMRVTARV